MPVLGLPLTPPREPVEQANRPGNSDDTPEDEESVDHGVSSAIHSAKPRRAAQKARAAMTTGQDTSDSPRAYPMTMAAVIRFATSAIFSASTARRRGLNRSIVVSRSTIPATTVAHGFSRLFSNRVGADGRFCHARPAVGRQFLRTCGPQLRARTPSPEPRTPSPDRFAPCALRLV